MDEEMELEPVFEVREIDIDYEFDAACFFDFTRDESLAEAREAELWFESAKSYPPSPFVAKMFLREEFLLDNVNTFPKTKEVQNTTALINNDSDDGLNREFDAIDVDNRGCEATGRKNFANLRSGNLRKVLNQPSELTTGLAFYNHMSNDKLKAKLKSSFKSGVPRSSTLMKPTASQMAKQNQPPQVGGSRFQKPLVQNHRSLCNASMVESQAPKRQKLEGGHLRKVADAKPQTDFIHKMPKKVTEDRERLFQPMVDERDAAVDKNPNSKLKLTIPREPDLETAQRAQRIRSKNNTEMEHPGSAAHRFVARPLNRKILEAPSLPLPKKSTPRLPQFQEFRLKTSERAVQQTSAVSSSSLHCCDSDKVLEKPVSTNTAENKNKDLRRPIIMDVRKHDDCGIIHKFKARPLNKKIFSSKGDIGVFRNSKRETTVPMEFNFHTGKRIQHNPPTELFSKLSLGSLQPNNGFQLKLPQPNCIKGLKENRMNSLQPEHEVSMVKGKPPLFGEKQIFCGSNGSSISEAGNLLHARRSLGIR